MLSTSSHRNVTKDRVRGLQKERKGLSAPEQNTASAKRIARPCLVTEGSELLVDRCSGGDSGCTELGLSNLALVEGLGLCLSLLLEALDDVLVAPAVFV